MAKLQKIKKTKFIHWVFLIFIALTVILTFYFLYQTRNINTKGTLKIIKGKASINKKGVQEIKINVNAGQYSPNLIFAKKGIPLIIYIKIKEVRSCTRKIIFPDLKLTFHFKKGINTLKFIPIKEGKFIFTCENKMVKGVLVIE
jgi:plastocyanin domain-containing protein